MGCSRVALGLVRQAKQKVHKAIEKLNKKYACKSTELLKKNAMQIYGMQVREQIRKFGQMILKAQ